jgi:uncharacterized protein
MNAFEVLFSPVVLFFVLGAIAALVRSDLSIPEAIAKGMSIYLITAIGLKGGAEVALAGFSLEIIVAGAAGIALSALLPIPAFFALRKFAGLNPVNAAAAAAHYGSVSIVTFVTGVEVLTNAGLPPAGYMVAVLALMESPAIITGLILAKSAGGPSEQSMKQLVHEAALNGSVFLLMGSFVIGIIIGKEGMAPIAPFFDSAFRGVLCLFLLDMGLLAARRLRQTGALSARVIVLAIVLPVVNGIIGIAIAALMGMDPGSATAFAILAASASYIAVPAVMRLALPQADPGLYLGMSLAVTFPFNILIGIPLYAYFATKVIGS